MMEKKNEEKREATIDAQGAEVGLTRGLLLGGSSPFLRVAEHLTFRFAKLGASNVCSVGENVKTLRAPSRQLHGYEDL